MNCISCKHWNPRGGDPKLAKLGFAPCRIKSPPGHTYSGTYERECQDHKPVAAEVERKRREWVA